MSNSSPHGIESIGEYTFFGCIFTNFRVPSLITLIPDSMLASCKSMVSVEMPKNITEIRYQAFFNCNCLRNVAFPPDALVSNNILHLATDLLLLLGLIAEIVSELKHRFDRLSVHNSVCFQWLYQQGVLQHLITFTSGNELDPTGNQQDYMRMTPLHILACSSVHNL